MLTFLVTCISSLYRFSVSAAQALLMEADSDAPHLDHHLLGSGSGLHSHWRLPPQRLQQRNLLTYSFILWSVLYIICIL